MAATAVVLAVVLTRGSTAVRGSDDGPTIGIVAGTPAVGSSNAGSSSRGVATLFRGIPQHGLVLGRPDAPVTLVEYADLQCGYCGTFETTQLPALVAKYVRPGKLKVELKPWDFLDVNHPGTDDSLRGQKVTIAAGRQDKAFQLSTLIYENQRPEGTRWLDDAMVSRLAAGVDGLDTNRLAADANSAATESLAARIDAYANAQPDFGATPVFLLARGNEAPRLFGVGLPDLTQLEARIDALLQ